MPAVRNGYKSQTSIKRHEGQSILTDRAWLTQDDGYCVGTVDAPRTDGGKLFAGLFALYAGLVFLA
jgi:hypothetical protein